jgi:hypothetical protein
MADMPEGVSPEALIQFSKSRNSAWSKWFEGKLKDIQRSHELWRNVQQATDKKGNQVPLPVGYSILESVSARLNSVLLNRAKFVDAVSEIAQADNSKQSIVEDFVNQNLIDQSRKPQKGKATIKSGLLDGIAIVRSVWKREPYTATEPQYEADPMTGELIPVGEVTAQLFREYWTFEKKSISSMAWEPTCTTKIEDSPWIRERAFMAFNDLVRWKNEGRIWDISALKNVVPSGMSGEEKSDFEGRLKKSDGDKEWRKGFSYDKVYQIDEWFADVTVGEGDEARIKKMHWFVAENDYLLYAEENVLEPKRAPYVSSPNIMKPDSIIGLSLLETVSNLLALINSYGAKHNSLVGTASNLNVFYGEKSGIKRDQKFDKVVNMVPVQDARDIQPFQFNPSVVEIVKSSIEFWATFAREATGANEQFQGIEGADTATEFQGLQAAAGSRFADIADTYNQSLFEGLAYECLWMYQQLGVDGQMVYHPQSEETAGVALTRADIQGQYRFVASSVNTENYKARQVVDDTAFVAQMVEANANPAVMGGRIYNIPKHIEEISLPLRGQKNSKDAFVQVPPVVVPGPVTPVTPGTPPVPADGGALPMVPSEPV